MSTKWKVVVRDTGERQYCQYARISNKKDNFYLTIEWTMGYACDAESRRNEKHRKKSCIALAREVCAFLNRKGAKP